MFFFYFIYFVFFIFGIAMNLIIDIGNTRTKIYLFKKDEIVEKYFFFNEEAKAIEKQLSQIKYAKCLISSTAELAAFYKKLAFIELDHNTSIPLTLDYKTPSTLGSDRIALSVGAETLFPNKNCLIIGTGTCITIDFKDENACYLGGAISPGLTIRLQSLNTFTDKLPLIKPNSSKKEFLLIGKSTVESIESGVFNGTFAEIEGTIARYKEIYKDLTVILTGGDQEIFEKNLKSNIFTSLNLQAIGLNRILNYNAEK